MCNKLPRSIDPCAHHTIPILKHPIYPSQLEVPYLPLLLGVHSKKAGFSHPLADGGLRGPDGPRGLLLRSVAWGEAIGWSSVWKRNMEDSSPLDSMTRAQNKQVKETLVKYIYIMYRHTWAMIYI